ncbi:MAG: phosphotransferase family protein [Holosporaceae bacterium]|jgi:thiamine kinase-like enzyme|nr:phosphotransferase family protein [Holosporaceae bacterium]
MTTVKKVLLHARMHPQCLASEKVYKSEVNNFMRTIAKITTIFLFLCFCGCQNNHKKNTHQETSKVIIQRIDGWSNFAYLVLIENKKLILRIPKKGTSKLKALLKIATHNEYINSNQAYFWGIGAKVVFFDSSNDVFLLEYIKNKKTLEETDLQDENMLNEVTIILKKLHSSKTKFNNNINIFSILERLVNFFDSNYMNSMPKDLSTVMRMVEQIKYIFGRLDIPSTPCHYDPNPGNFLLANKRVYLIDWEYSGNNDPAWDLALLSATGNFTHKQDNQMMNVYGNKRDNLLFKRVVVYKALVQLWRFFFARFQSKYINDPVEKQRFWEMSNIRYNDCKKILSSNEFKDALNKLDQGKSR